MQQYDVSNTRFIYFSTMRCTNVFQTQVIGWLHELKKNDLNFKLIKFQHIKYIFSAKERRDYKKTKEKYDGKVHKFYFFPTKFKFSNLMITTWLIITNISYLIRRRKIVIQTRDDSFWQALKYFKRFSPKLINIIYDSRAASAEEFKYIYKKKLNNSDIQKKLNRIEMNAINMVDVSDSVFCVSDVLINYHRKKCHSNHINKFFLYPCNADRNMFFFSKKERRKIRAQYKITNRKVITYSGGLLMPWHRVDKIFEFFQMVQNINCDYFLLILTRDLNIALEYKKKYNISDKNILILTVDNPKVYTYLSASDFGLLLRDDVPMNNVASPTKFAEYIMCGLPVIISENIGDFSEFVKENKIGVVISKKIKGATKIVDKLNFLLDNKNMLKIIKLGNKYYSKQSHMKSIINQYYSIISSSNE